MHTLQFLKKLILIVLLFATPVTQAGWFSDWVWQPLSDACNLFDRQSKITKIFVGLGTGVLAAAAALVGIKFWQNEKEKKRKIKEILKKIKDPALENENESENTSREPQEQKIKVEPSKTESILTEIKKEEIKEEPQKTEELKKIVENKKLVETKAIEPLPEIDSSNKKITEITEEAEMSKKIIEEKQQEEVIPVKQEEINKSCSELQLAGLPNIPIDDITLKNENESGNTLGKPQEQKIKVEPSETESVLTEIKKEEINEELQKTEEPKNSVEKTNIEENQNKVVVVDGCQCEKSTDIDQQKIFERPDDPMEIDPEEPKKDFSKNMDTKEKEISTEELQKICNQCLEESKQQEEELKKAGETLLEKRILRRKTITMFLYCGLDGKHDLGQEIACDTYPGDIRLIWFLDAKNKEKERAFLNLYATMFLQIYKPVKESICKREYARSFIKLILDLNEKNNRIKVVLEPRNYDEYEIFDSKKRFPITSLKPIVDGTYLRHDDQHIKKDKDCCIFLVGEAYGSVKKVWLPLLDYIGKDYEVKDGVNLSDLPFHCEFHPNFVSRDLEGVDLKLLKLSENGKKRAFNDICASFFVNVLNPHPKGRRFFSDEPHPKSYFIGHTDVIFPYNNKALVPSHVKPNVK
jgi:hypothetical protein